MRLRFSQFDNIGTCSICARMITFSVSDLVQFYLTWSIGPYVQHWQKCQTCEKLEYVLTRDFSEVCGLLPAATKLGQGNIFTGDCLSTGGRGVCLSACWDIPPREQTISPPDQTPREQTHTPWEQTTPPDQTPQSKHPQEQTPPEQTPPPREADFSIWSSSGQYASYWNAFLF